MQPTTAPKAGEGGGGVTTVVSPPEKQSIARNESRRNVLTMTSGGNLTDKSSRHESLQ